MGEGHTSEPQTNHERLTVAQAAAALGITEGAVRSRIKRGTLPTTKEDGTVFVLLGGGTSQANQTPNAGVPGDQSELIEALRDQIEDLRRERDEWREQARITDRLLSAAMERIPAIEAPSAERGPSETVDEQQGSGEPRSDTRGAATLPSYASFSAATPFAIGAGIAAGVANPLLVLLRYLLERR